MIRNAKDLSPDQKTVLESLLGRRLDERFLPSTPAPSQYDPEQLVWCSESPARALGVKSEQLLTQGKIFEDEILAGPECTNNPAEEVPEPPDHTQNLTGTLPIELAAKSLILRVYDVLMNDRYNRCCFRVLKRNSG